MKEADAIYLQQHPELRVVKTSEPESSLRGLYHDEELVFNAWRMAHLNGWKHIPTIEEVANQRVTWLRDLFYINQQVMWQLDMVEFENESPPSNKEKKT